MHPKLSRLGRSLAVCLIAGCGDPNLDGPRVPPHTLSKPPPDGQGASGEAPRRPVTKNSREIVNPE
jgi:hypothetical protein